MVVQPLSDAPDIIKFFSRFACIAIVLLAPLRSVLAEDAVLVPNYMDPRERIAAPDLQPFPRIRFITTVDFPPFSFLDQTSRLSGFHIDLARAICAELEILSKCQIQALPWSELPGALQSGQAEAIISGIAMTPASRSEYRFTRTYMTLPARFVARNELAGRDRTAETLTEQRVGVMAGTAHEAMLRAWFPDLKPVTFSRQEWMFDALKSGSVAAIFGDGLQLSFWLASQSAEGCCGFLDGPYVSQRHLGEGLAIAVRPRNARLAVAFDHALAALNRNGRFAELYLRWFPNGLF
jgi:polar amino acid transport system substrate-binding protein